VERTLTALASAFPKGLKSEAERRNLALSLTDKEAAETLSQLAREVSALIEAGRQAAASL
jgi:hypothetical protein